MTSFSWRRGFWTKLTIAKWQNVEMSWRKRCGSLLVWSAIYFCTRWLVLRATIMLDTCFSSRFIKKPHFSPYILLAPGFGFISYFTILKTSQIKNLMKNGITLFAVVVCGYISLTICGYLFLIEFWFCNLKCPLFQMLSLTLSVRN